MPSFFRALGIPIAVGIGLVLVGGASQSATSPPTDLDVDVSELAMPLDDECAAAGSEEEREACSINALQLRGVQRQQALSKNKDDDDDDDNDDIDDSGDDDKDAGDDDDSDDDEEKDKGTASKKSDNYKCADIDDASNRRCASVVRWASERGRNDPHADHWFGDMPSVTGMDRKSATQDDFQRLYFCAPPGGKQCGTPPCQCSKPPCNRCNVNQKDPSERPGCDENPDSIHCKPPKKPFDYKGMAWPTMKYYGVLPQHIFAIGDWGGMDGSLKPIEGRPNIIAYRWGARAGPSVFPRTRWNLHHTVELCSHKAFLACFNSHGDGHDCPASCGYVKGVDDQPQQLVAKAMRDRAYWKDPAFILNVGDNFYWGGIEKTCGTPMDEISYTAHHQFDQIFEGMYHGKGLDGKPWLSVLGNHDWGGRQFNNGWDQQIAYTWASDRWIMPAPYWMTHVEWPLQFFSADLYFLDSNFNDAKNPPEDSEHNICGSAHNPPGATCGAIGGPESIETCPQYFEDLWQEQKQWMEQKLSESSATWQIATTHFPCGEDGENQQWYAKLHTQYGLDLLVTGHRHDQELWKPSMGKNHMGGLTCIVTGGGGGITSEATPNPHNKRDWYGEAEYGFFDLTLTKFMMRVESVNWDGKVVSSTTVHPQ